jgi:hypothetical protein
MFFNSCVLPVIITQPLILLKKKSLSIPFLNTKSFSIQEDLQVFYRHKLPLPSSLNFSYVLSCQDQQQRFYVTFVSPFLRINRVKFNFLLNN